MPAAPSAPACWQAVAGIGIVPYDRRRRVARELAAPPPDSGFRRTCAKPSFPRKRESNPSPAGRGPAGVRGKPGTALTPLPFSGRGRGTWSTSHVQGTGEATQPIPPPQRGDHRGARPFVAHTKGDVPMDLDLIIRGGTVVDGSGQPGQQLSDVGVSGDRISAVGDLSAATAAQTLDATGLVVTPGFIDIHTHSEFSLLLDPARREQGPPGRHDRGGQQLLLCAVSDAPPRHRRSQVAAHHARRRATRLGLERPRRLPPPLQLARAPRSTSRRSPGTPPSASSPWATTSVPPRPTS